MSALLKCPKLAEADFPPSAELPAKADVHSPKMLVSAFDPLRTFRVPT
jgi:hypothetical protein